MNKELKDYKFVYKISCEPKISPNQDVATIAQKIIGIRVKMFDEMTKELLKQIAEEKGYAELLVIDESKIDNFVKALKALEIIKKKDIHKTMLSLTKSADEYNHFIDDVSEEMQLTQEEYELLKEVFCDD